MKLAKRIAITVAAFIVAVMPALIAVMWTLNWIAMSSMIVLAAPSPHHAFCLLFATLITGFMLGFFAGRKKITFQ